MLRLLKTLLTTSTTSPTLTPEKVLTGYLRPQTHQDLLSQPQRKLVLRQIWDNTSLPEAAYESLYIEPIKTLAESVQNLPAAAEGEWSREGGFLALTLRFCACCVRLAKAHMFPPGAAPEEQAAKDTLWNAVVFWSALIYHLPLLAQIEGELTNGSLWLPGTAMPAGPYRFKFHPSAAHRCMPIFAARLLPTDGIKWLATEQEALEVIAAQVAGAKSVMPLIAEILSRACEVVDSPLRYQALHLVPSPDSGEGNIKGPDALLTQADVNTLTGTNADGLGSAIIAPQVAPAEDLSVVPASPQPDQKPENHDHTALLLSMFSNELLNTVPDVRISDFPTALTEPVPDISPAEYEALYPESLADNLEESNLYPPLDPGRENFADIQLATQIDSEATILPREEQSESEGERFLSWLKASMRDSSLSINKTDSLLHVVSGFLFIPLPAAIYRYISASDCQSDKNTVQASFEKLGILHMKDGQRFFKIRAYADEGREGRFRRQSGYLIKLAAVIPDESETQDSQYVMIES